MLNNIKEIYPLCVSTYNSIQFNNELQFSKYLLFNQGFYIKYQEHILYLTYNTSNFSPLSIILSEGEYIRILESFNRFNKLNLLLNTFNSRIISCKQEKITNIPHEYISYLIYCIDEYFKLEEERYIIDDVLSVFLLNIRGENTKKLDEFISQYIGMGKGLTPDFDDLLIGVLWTFDAFYNKHNIFRNAIHSGLKKKNTTSVSNAFYSCAFENHYSYNLVKVGEAVRSQNFSGINKTIQEIKNYGHTSGKYLLYGIFIGLNIIFSNDIF